jgi:alkylated DNA repair dioxygenase AlkB
MSADLFGPDPSENLLPRDGAVRYFGPVLAPDAADRVFEILLRGIPWRRDELVMFGKRIVTAREVAWFGDRETGYTYSGTTKQALPWTPELAELRKLAETLTGSRYNSCLLNLYHHGGEGMGWHSDNEKSIAPESAIASLSLGAERVFKLRHKATKETVSIPLPHGSLLVMEGATQVHWAHSVPKSARIAAPRINLTFRQML